MRIVQFVSVAVLSCVAYSANASDNMNKKSAPNAAKQTATSKHDWSGFKLGLNLGGARANDTVNDLGNGEYACYSYIGPFDNCLKLKTDGSGFVAGASAGYDFQIENAVIGAQFDFDFASINKSTTQEFAGTYNHNLELSSLSTLRGRIGYLLSDDVLLYLTGGVAGVNIRNSLQFVDIFGKIDPQWDEKKFRFGYVVGAGTEYALTNRWTMKVEGAYLGMPDTKITVDVSVNEFVSMKFKNDGYIARAGLNYNF